MIAVRIFVDPVQAVFDKTIERLLRPTSFVGWIAVFHRAIRGEAIGVTLHDCAFPEAVPQRRMIHRMALAHARRAPRTRWPLGAGLAPVPPRAAAGSLAAPLAPGMGLGRLGADTLLVGDRVQPNAPEWMRLLGWPFISGLRTGCSGWLAEQLEAAGIPEEDLRWVNGCTSDGRVDEFALRNALMYGKPKRVVALGRYAAKALDAVGAEYDEVDHPQYWKRFHSKKPYLLRRLLCSCQ